MPIHYYEEAPLKMSQSMRSAASVVKITVRKGVGRNRSRSRSKSRIRERSRNLSRPRSRSNSRPRPKKYQINGNGKSVILEFSQKKKKRGVNNFGGFKSTANRKGSAHRSKGKKLGQSVGLSEFKRRAEELKRKKGINGNSAANPIDDDLAREIDQLRQMHQDLDVGGVYDINDQDTGWVNLDTNNNEDFFAEFLKDINCRAFRCADPKDVPSLEEEQRIEIEEIDLEEDLREMVDYKERDQEMKGVMKEEMDRLKFEEEEMRREQKEAEKYRQREVREELERIQREEEDMRRRQEYGEQQRQRKAREDLERIQREEEDMRRGQEYEDQQRQRKAREDLEWIQREEEEELRREREFENKQRQRMAQEEQEEFERLQREKDLQEMIDFKNEQEETKDYMNEEMERIQHEMEEEQRKEAERTKQEEEAEREKDSQRRQEAEEMEEFQRDVEEMKKMQERNMKKFAENQDVENGSSKRDADNWFSRLAKKTDVRNFIQCGGNMEILDMFDWTRIPKDDESVGTVNTYEVERTMYRVDDHQNSPPTALYAAIGTQHWNIALRRLLDEPKEASVWVSNASVDGDEIYRFLPLHIACLSGAPLLLVTLLLQTYPNAAKYNAMGKLPIHMACETLADHRIVFLLLNAWPESINVKDGDENTPIEVASLREPCDERKQIIQVLTKKLECTVVKTPTPLYEAIDSQRWNFAIKRLVEMPQEATVWVSFTKKSKENRFLPLHIACHLGAPFFLISDLVHAYPDAVRKKTTHGQLPLHIACECHEDERLIELLLNFWPESLFVKDDEGNKAMEIVQAAEFSSVRASIITLLQKKLEHQDTVVYAPTKLYSLIEEKNWDLAVRKCLESPVEVSTWVGSCQKIEDAKLLPLHVACASGASLILVAVLIQSYKKAVKRTTNNGKLPIHLACENHADHRIISLLLHTFPESYSHTDEKGNTPIQVALLSSTGPERTKIVETLLAFENNGDDAVLELPDEMLNIKLVSMDQPVEIDGPAEKVTAKKKKSRKSRKSKEDHKVTTPWGAGQQMFT